MRSKTVLCCLIALLATAPSAWARYDELTEPSVALPEGFPKQEREEIFAALKPSDAKFVSGHALNSFTTLNYSGDTKTLNLFLDRLAKCSGVSVGVLFSSEKSMDDCDWRVSHMASDPGKFTVRINLKSPHVKLEDLFVPESRIVVDRTAATIGNSQTKPVGLLGKPLGTQLLVTIDRLAKTESNNPLIVIVNGKLLETSVEIPLRAANPSEGVEFKHRNIDHYQLEGYESAAADGDSNATSTVDAKRKLNCFFVVTKVIELDSPEAATIAKICELSDQPKPTAAQLDQLKSLLNEQPILANARRVFLASRKPSSDDDYTPLLLAARQGNDSAAVLLLKHGAEVNCKTGGGWTPLLLAAQEGNLKVAKVLVEQGADLKAKTDFRPQFSSDDMPGQPGYAPGEKRPPPTIFPAVPARTALQWAVEEKHADVAAYLKSLAK